MNIKPNQLTDIGDFPITKWVWKCGSTQRKVKGANYTMPANDNTSQSAGTRGRTKRKG
jgi:hypothetical protein